MDAGISAKLLSEFLGTYFLVLTVGLNVLSGSAAGAFSIAGILMCMIFALGTVSGAHFNPAVTVAIMAADLAVAQIDVGQAALTGESLPVTLYEGDQTLMGSTVVRGETEGTVEYTGVDTFFDKTAALLASTEELPNVQYLLIMIVRNLTILSLAMCTIVSFYMTRIAPFMVARRSWWC